MTKQTITVYDILRVVTAILVVIGHSSYIWMMTPWGGIDYYTTFEGAPAAAFTISEQITAVIYRFHMPLFIALSGALFVYTLQKKEMSLISLAAGKAKRLLIPFFVVTCLYAVPLKWLSGYYQGTEHLLKDIVTGQILLQGNSHLWFLVTLFCIFILFYLGREYSRRDSWLLWVMLLLIHLTGGHLALPSIIASVMQYGLWFYTGMCFERHREKLDHFLKKGRGGWCLIMIVGFFGIYLAEGLLGTEGALGLCLMEVMRLLECFLGMLIIYTICTWLEDLGIHQTSGFGQLADDSFGLYLYSDPWNYVFLMAGAKLTNSLIFISNRWYVGFYILRIAGTAMIAILVTKILRKAGVKYLA